MALRAILALPLRAMASLFSGRDGSKPPAGSNQSKDWRAAEGRRLWPARASSPSGVLGSRVPIATGDAISPLPGTPQKTSHSSFLALRWALGIVGGEYHPR